MKKSENEIRRLEETINSLIEQIYKLRTDISENKNAINTLIKKVEEIELK